MLTRLEVDGFKNLLDFSIDFGPLTCIAGPNGVGKSNILDVIEFLSLLADFPIVEAALKLRGADPETADLRDLFWTDGKLRRTELRFAAEMIVDPEVSDDFGRLATASSTFLRYEIVLGYRHPSRAADLGGLELRSETLDYITEGQASKHLKFPHAAAGFRSKVVFNKRRTRAGYITVRQNEHGQTEIEVHQDGGSRGPAQTSPAAVAQRTIVGISNTSATPTILAARREMQRWRILALEPSAMRRADRFQTEPRITSAGGHLPATLHRLTQAESRDHGDTRASQESSPLSIEIAQRLGDLVPVSSLGVVVDTVRRILTLEVEEASGVRIPATGLSDGTLRFLALAILASDPEAIGVICLEEPENGVHPGKMEAMVDLLHELAVDAEEPPSRDNTLRQVIVASHSPVFVQLQERDDLLLATTALIRTDDAGSARTLRCRPLSGTWRHRDGTPAVGKASIMAYLTEPPGAQLQLSVA